MGMFRSRLSTIVRHLNPLRGLRWLAFRFANWRRRRAPIDYIMFTMPSQMPMFSESRDWLRQRVLGPAGMSLTELDRLLEQIGDDPRPKGVVLHWRGVSMPLAHLQTLRNSLLRLKAKGKRIICFAQSYNLALYYVVSVAHEIILQPGGEVDTLGLRSEATFLKDALDLIGIQLDSVAISPFKGAYDRFTRSGMSAEGQAQLDWLLDSQYEMLVQGIAEGRRLTTEAVLKMIDSAPHLDAEALTAGYVDGVMSEEDLQRKLGSNRMLSWREAEKKLIQKWRRTPERYVALLKVSGLMFPGESAKPPIDLPIPFIGGERAGDLTVVQQVRRVMKDKRAAAVILYIDSGGGASSAAEAMTSALLELGADRPLVAYMDTVAASGGYYIATPAQWIVAQPGTITGSIGVLLGKPVTAGLFTRLKLNRVEVTRGANASYLSDNQPFTEAQRARALQSIQHIYQQFVAHVARSRKLDEAAVDAVGGGRVWTGVQAKAHGLVDELGDLRLALAKARQLAGLPEDTPLVLVSGKGRPLPAQLAERSQPAAALHYVRQQMSAILNGKAQLLLPFHLDNQE